MNESDKADLRKVKDNVLPGVTNVPQKTGTFATRSPYRPNPIGLTLVKILSINKNLVFIDSIDAHDKTPIIDIKPYLPNGDQVDEVRLPDWYIHLKDSSPEMRSKKTRIP
jgi:tRNA-Thr(GGU) m(6)t(6)A37 methyltransferase TsaA